MLSNTPILAATAGFGVEWLAEIGRLINAEKSDVFDVLAYVAYAMAPITRAERVEAHKGDIFKRYDGKLQAFLVFVLAQYVSQGVEELDRDKLGSLLQLKYQPVAVEIPHHRRRVGATGRSVGGQRNLCRFSAISTSGYSVRALCYSNRHERRSRFLRQAAIPLQTVVS